MQDFTIRIYGLYINDNHEILVSDERIGETTFTKFPGGGLEKGEGTKTCLQREWLEEMNTEIEVLDHFYTTDFYQASAFHTNVQVISIYYLVKPKHTLTVNVSNNINDFSFQKEKEESFRFIPLNDLKEEMLTYPIDKKVVLMLREGLL